ncbi:MAG TPA: nicotinate phosphoribosyltransferase [Lacunisphaera sp.]|nr:nicotinate phosphoribosyltransferase [Lacunisphaera sp.]
MNPLTLIDGYKYSHGAQYPHGTTRVYSNWTPRESRVPGVSDVVFFGLQYFLQRYLGEEYGSFFAQPVEQACAEYERRHIGYLGPNNIGSDHVRALHELGHVPLEFKALPEGTLTPLRVPMFTIENTHDEFAWLTNYVETILSNLLWLPCTSATTAHHMREMLDAAALATGSPLDFVPWQGHDFSFRGMPGPEAAALSGMGHLLSFTGTDTVPAFDLIERYYGPVAPDYLMGGSVPATEHSVMCAGGELSERETFDRILDIYPTGIVSVVSDTWNLWRVLTEILPSLKERIMARAGKLVIRPDSGDPADIVCGDPEATPGSPEYKGVIELLWEVFGGATTTTGHTVLDPHIGCIYGDGITYDRAKEITDRLAAKGFASANMVFGIGSWTYQGVTRDTYGFAMKATWCKVNGEGRDLYKRPVTGNGMKNSAKGRLAVHRSEHGRLYLVNLATPEEEAHSLLEPVWRDGRFVRRQTFDDVRQVLRSQRRAQG